MSRAAGEFHEGDIVRKIERDGEPSYGANDLTVVHAFGDSGSLWLHGVDMYRSPPTRSGLSMGSQSLTFTDNAFWSDGDPKYVLIKSIEEAVADELMA